jgi:hypothetical protein
MSVKCSGRYILHCFQGRAVLTTLWKLSKNMNPGLLIGKVNPIELLDAPSKRDQLISKGFDRYQQFSWDQTAAQTFEVYRSLL